MNLKTRMLRPPLTIMLVSSLLSASLSDSVNIRLVNGRGTCSGRVEVNVTGQWGSVCNDGWNITNAEVVCRELGCGKPVGANGSASFGKGSGPIYLINVRCSGPENIITECSHNKVQKRNCSHDEDAGVTCSERMFLASLTPFIISGVATGLLLILMPIIIYFTNKYNREKTQITEDANMDSEGFETTHSIIGVRNEMDDDYENAEDVFLQREDSHVSDEDYVNVDMHTEKLELGNNNEGAKYTNPRISMRNEIDDEDDYEKPQTIISEKEDSDVNDDDYINVDAGVEKMSVCSDCPEKTHKTTHVEMETDSENDYENAEATVHQRENSDDSDESDEDYVNVDRGDG
ncbi:scavenger receptor cysteine-rich type 1 protein M130 [Pygocentrus nattereri]|uniref:scavenger receptor cysteine-rich type 1 protein M130 n=1 Tax=Pygocentrus nattereri TaxID=42514 RepID=UPI001891AAD5|nr:scavenger receptor cysteine-rich type 1 protein M130 [Pygocentrus nattereri]